MDKFGWSLSSSSPIGKNSDDEGGENEAESSYKGPLDMMKSLEEVLPIRFEFLFCWSSLTFFVLLLNILSEY